MSEEIKDEGEYTLAELSPEEQVNLTKDMTEVLEKYNAEIGVHSAITMMKRVPVENDSSNQETTGEEEAKGDAEVKEA